MSKSHILHTILSRMARRTLQTAVLWIHIRLQRALKECNPAICVGYTT